MAEHDARDDLAIDGPAVEGIAVIGMSGRFPGAADLEAFWRNLRDGVESISRFSAEQLLAAGIEAAVIADPAYVRAGGVLDDVELFDAAFFGFNPREAEILDPHHRLFLEHSWQALENAGYDSARYDGAISVYGGMSGGDYFMRHLAPNAEVVQAAGDLQLRIYNDKDFLASLTAYKLDLRGPSLSVQTACSTSLVATCLGCQSLLNYQCDMALAGGVCVPVPSRSGYYAHEGVFSPSGHCRAFAADAEGTVAGAGVGVVLLKRLSEALADGDTVYAVVRGWAMNNDGSAKMGYTAPSVDGQAEVVAMAQAVAGVDPETVSYIEAHGTGTSLGDQIEIAALAQVFGESKVPPGSCAVGSVKTNIGHLDAAAGAASLIKTVLALDRRALPPSLHCPEPNPKIDFPSTPFYVNTELREWRSQGPGRAAVRRAGVSAFAVGGVNAHLVLEEAPVPAASGAGRPAQLLVLSARTKGALEKLSERLAGFLRRERMPLADVAYTLAVGRRVFEHRRAVACHDPEDAAAVLAGELPGRLLTYSGEGDRSGQRTVAFLFPGLGDHYVGMASELYRREPVFRRHLDRCAELLRPELGLDFRELLYPDGAATPKAAAAGPDLRRMLGRSPESRGEGEPDGEAGELIRTALAQPVLFSVEYALARLWMEWGIRPRAMIGYSIGEYVAACLAGVFRLEDALRLVAGRARLIDALPAGAMLAISLAVGEVEALLGEALLGEEVSLAAVNGPELAVVAGPVGAVAGLERKLRARGVTCRRLQTSHAFHSSMLAPIVDDFAELVAGVERRPPEIPFLSNVTGTWIGETEAVDPRYWAEHLCRPVRYAEGVGELLAEPGRVLLEVGPGQALSSWALQLPPAATDAATIALPSLRHAYDARSDQEFLLTTLGRLWVLGVAVDWQGFYEGERRRRVALPTYPFERRRFWIEPRPASAPEPEATLEPKGELADWFYLPVWREKARWPSAAALAPATQEGSTQASTEQAWLLFADPSGLAEELAGELERSGATVILAAAGKRYEAVEAGAFVLDPDRPEDYRRLLDDLGRQGLSPGRIVHLWNLAAVPETGSADGTRRLSEGFYSVIYLAQALGEQSGRGSGKPAGPLEVTVVTRPVHQVTGHDDVDPWTAAVAGPCAVIPQEYPGLAVRHLDVARAEPGSRAARAQLAALRAELLGEPGEPLVALRAGRRFLRDFDPAPIPAPASGDGLLRRDGVYLVTGGLGGVGLALAGELARSARAKLVLAGRTLLPVGDERRHWLAEHGEHDATSVAIRRLEAVEAAASEVMLASADVTDEARMGELRREVLARFGAIHGVIHAAGVEPGGMIQVKDRPSADAVLAPKLQGTRVVTETFAGDGLDFLLLCSSLTSIVGGFGLVDHAAANAFLDAWADRRSSPSVPAVPVTSINWDTWLEVGQAAAAAARFDGGPASAAAASGGKLTVLRTLVHPLVAGCVRDDSALEVGREEGAGALYRGEVSSADWVVSEHRIGGEMLMPGTGYLEILRAIGADRFGAAPIEIRQLLFASPMVVREDESRELDVELEARDGHFDVRIHSRSRTADGFGEWREHLRAKLGRAPTAGAVTRDLEALRAACRNGDRGARDGSAVPGDALSVAKEEGLSFGPRWQNLTRRVIAGDDQALVELELAAEFVDDLEAYPLHPALLDAATGFVQGLEEGTYLPLGYDRVVLEGPLAARIYSHARFAAGAERGDTIACDLEILDERGRRLVAIEGFTLRRVADPRAVAASVSEPPAGRRGGALASLEGLRPAQGGEVLRRLLANPLLPPQVVVSTKDFGAVRRQAAAFGREGLLEHVDELRSRAVVERPNLQTEYVAPRNQLEERMAAFWRELLGVDRVGIHDNFFDLGGDSLLATRWIAFLDETLDVQLSLRAVFEAPTVAGMATRVVQAQAEEADRDSLAEAMAEIQQLSPDELRELLDAERRAAGEDR